MLILYTLYIFFFFRPKYVVEFSSYTLYSHINTINIKTSLILISLFQINALWYYVLRIANLLLITSLFWAHLFFCLLFLTLQYMHIIDNSSHHTLLIFVLFFSFSSFLSCKKSRRRRLKRRKYSSSLLYVVYDLAICISPYIQVVCMNDGIFSNDRCSINVKSSLFLQIILSKCLKRLEVFREIVLI